MAEEIKSTPAASSAAAGPDLVAVITEDALKSEKADDGYDIFVSTEAREISDEESRRVARKLDLHLLPLMCVLYGLNYIDKVAMGWAVLFSFRADLGLHGDQYSWASSIFYFGYLGAQYPANYLLTRFRTTRVISIGTIVWGGLMLCHMACRNYAGLLAVRFFLGVAEAAVTPGFVLYTSHWYTRKEQVGRTMIWGAMQGLFAILGALMSYGLGHIENTGLASWKYIFLVLGILSILVGIGWLLFLPESPATARWLNEDEKAIAVQRVASNMTGIKGYDWKYYQIWQCLKDPKAWFLFFFVFFSMLPNGGLTNFGSLVISGLGFGTFHTLLVGMPSSIVSAGSMCVWAYFSRKYEGLRTWGMIVPMIPAIAGIAAVYGTENTSANKWGRLVAYWLINSYAVTWPFTLTIVGQNIAGHTKKAATNVLLLIAFSAGNIGGPFFFRSHDAPKYVLAITIILVCFSLCFFIAVGLRVYLILANRHRDRLYGKVETTEEMLDGARLGMHDKTDFDNPDFRYVL